MKNSSSSIMYIITCKTENSKCDNIEQTSSENVKQHFQTTFNIPTQQPTNHPTNQPTNLQLYLVQDWSRPFSSNLPTYESTFMHFHYQPSYQPTYKSISSASIVSPSIV